MTITRMSPHQGIEGRNGLKSLTVILNVCPVNSTKRFLRAGGESVTENQDVFQRLRILEEMILSGTLA